MLPVNVEVLVEACALPHLENVHEHVVITVEGHVIGNYVLNPAHATILDRLEKRVQTLRATQGWINLIRVDDVIPVLAPGSRAEYG